ncbi:unnamed protein product, partial [Brassica oleracea var. botrytis]
DCFWISSGGSPAVLKGVSRVSVALWSSDEVSVTGCVEGFRELAVLGEGDRFGSGLVSLRHRWQSGASLPPSCLRLASCSFISVGLSHSLSRWLSVDVLFLVAACRFFGASGTGPVSDPSLRLLYSTFSRSSSLGMKLWVGVAASLTVEMHYLLRGSGRSREINLRLPPQEPLFFIECLSSVSLDSQLLLRKVSG